MTTYTDISDWLDMVTYYRNVTIAYGWKFVDTLREGIDQFGGQDRHAVANLYELASVQVGLTTKTLQNYVSVSRKFPPDRRPEGIEFGHCVALLGADPGLTEELLHETIAQGHSVERLRQVRWQRENSVPDNRNETDDLPFSGAGHNFATDAAPSVVEYETTPERLVDADWLDVLPTVRKLVAAILHGDKSTSLYELAQSLSWLLEDTP